MGLCLYVDLCFHASSLPCLHTFWHAIPTSFYIFNVFYFLVNLITDHRLRLVWRQKICKLAICDNVEQSDWCDNMLISRIIHIITPQFYQ